MSPTAKSKSNTPTSKRSTKARIPKNQQASAQPAISEPLAPVITLSDIEQPIEPLQEHNDKAEKETASSLHRQWLLLSRLTTNKWTGTRDLQKNLEHEGIEVSLRTIQRDLKQLSLRFPIECNGALPQGWRWKHDAPVHSLPHMNSSQAVTFMMVEDHLRHLLPASLLEELRPWFNQARLHLTGSKNQMRQWVNRVRIIPATQPLLPPKVDPEAQTAIYEGLLQDRQLKVTYRRRDDTDRTYQINPLALVQRGPVIYLVATRHDQPEVRMFVLHRFKKAVVTDQRAQRPTDFDLNDYLNSGEFGFKMSTHTLTPIKIRLKFTAKAGKSLLESKLSKDQQTSIDPQTGHIVVEATVPLTAQLVWWLRGYGNAVQVLDPPALIDAMLEDESTEPANT